MMKNKLILNLICSFIVLFLWTPKAISQNSLIEFEYPNILIHKSYFHDTLQTQIINRFQLVDEYILVENIGLFKFIILPKDHYDLFMDILNKIQNELNSKENLFYKFLLLNGLQASFHHLDTQLAEEKNELERLVFNVSIDFLNLSTELEANGYHIMDSIMLAGNYSSYSKIIYKHRRYCFPQNTIYSLELFFTSKANTPRNYIDRTKLYGNYYFYEAVLEEVILENPNLKNKSGVNFRRILINKIIQQFHNGELDYFKTSTDEDQ